MIVVVCGPAFKDVAHERSGDGILSAIDVAVDILKVEDPPGVPRMDFVADSGRGATAEAFLHLWLAFSCGFL